MIKIYVDTEEKQGILLDILDGSSKCLFLGKASGCLTGRTCSDCIKENIEFHVDLQKRK